MICSCASCALVILSWGTVVLVVIRVVEVIRTGAPSFGPSRRAWPARRRLWSSISWVGSLLHHQLASFSSLLPHHNTNGTSTIHHTTRNDENIQFTNPINLPVLPPIPPRTPPTLPTTFPAVLVTLLSPSEALLCACDAVSLAAPAVFCAVSAAVDAYRRWKRSWAWRRAMTRETAMDMMRCLGVVRDANGWGN